MTETEKIRRVMELLVGCEENEGCDGCCLAQDVDLDLDLDTAIIDADSNGTPFVGMSLKVRVCILMLALIKRIKFYKKEEPVEGKAEENKA